MPRGRALIGLKRGSGVFDPETIVGLTAWYDASTLGLADDAAVASWGDSSTNDATLTEATNTPTYKTAIQNGLGVVRFDGTNDRLSTTDAELLAVQDGDDLPYSAFIVVANNIVASTTRHIYAWTDKDVAAQTVSQLQSVEQAVDSRYVVRRRGDSGAAVTATTANPIFDDEVFQVVSVAFTGTAVSLWVNGAATDIAASSLDTVALDNVDTFAVGVNVVSTPAGFFSGDIGEILIYNTALSDVNRGAVEDYLGTKWGIAIA